MVVADILGRCNINRDGLFLTCKLDDVAPILEDGILDVAQVIIEGLGQDVDSEVEFGVPLTQGRESWTNTVLCKFLM